MLVSVTPWSPSQEVGAPWPWPQAARAPQQWVPGPCLPRRSCCACLSRVPAPGSAQPWLQPWLPHPSHPPSARSGVASRWRPAPGSGPRRSSRGAGCTPRCHLGTLSPYSKPAAWGRPRTEVGPCPSSGATPGDLGGGQRPAGVRQDPRRRASRHQTQQGYVAPARRGSPCGNPDGPPPGCVCAAHPSCLRPARLPASLPTARA